MKISLWIISIFILSACSKPGVGPPAALLPVPSPAQMAWHRMEQNALIHFTTNTFTDLEWGFGGEDPSIFNPSAFDADQWISTLKDTWL